MASSSSPEVKKVMQNLSVQVPMKSCELLQQNPGVCVCVFLFLCVFVCEFVKKNPGVKTGYDRSLMKMRIIICLTRVLIEICFFVVGLQGC